MAGQEWDLEAIVREVLRRLQQPGAGATAGAGPRRPEQVFAVPAPQPSAGETSRVEASDRHPASAVPAGPQPIPDATQLQLSDRTITLELVAGRLDGVREMLVPAGAVVTPAVRDELQRRQIVLRKGGDQAAGAAVRIGFVLGLVGDADSSGAAAAAVQAEAGAADRIQNPCVLEVVRQVMQAISAQTGIGVVLTDRPAVALCLANRRTGIRAAWGVNAASVREAARQIGANLLVLDPTRPSVHELRSMIREFLGGRHDCPAAYRRALGEES
jgi:ribose 5-phosphate isomerase RpiB